MRKLLFVPVLFAVAGTVAAGDEALFPAQQDGQWGLIDRDGEWVLSPRFEQIDAFSEGRGIAFDGDHFGVIDAAGDWVADPRFGPSGRSGDYRIPPLTPYRDGHTTYCWNPSPRRDRGCMLVDHDGEPRLSDHDHDALGRVSEGLLAFQPEGPFGDWGVLSIDGDVVIEPEFHEVGIFVDGLAPAAKDRRSWGFINTRGEWVIEPEYQETKAFSEGLAAVQIGSWHWAYINREGEVVLDGGYRDAWSFDNGIAMVHDDDTRDYIFIDSDGGAVLSELLERDDLCTILPFQNGLAAALVQAPDASGCGTTSTSRGDNRTMSAEHGVMAYFDSRGEMVWRAGD